MPSHAYRFFKDFDTGLLRQPEAGGRFEAYYAGIWHHVDDIDPLSGSCSPVTREQAYQYVPRNAVLDAPNEDARYEQFLRTVR